MKKSIRSRYSRACIIRSWIAKSIQRKDLTPNYLFEKGIDKILKKVGEEAAEIIIAAKNPNQEEVKYEMCDFLYHMMVLMAERGITWDDIMEEMAKR